jgi:hypothetical protein
MDETDALAKAYRVAASGDAARVFRFDDEKALKYHVLIHETHTNKPLVWAVPNLCTRDECDLLLEQAECLNIYGKEVSQMLLVKDMFDDHGGMEPLSDALLPRLQHDYNLHKSLRGNNEDVSDQVDVVSPKWRVLKLNVDEEFPAHIDGMDSVHQDCKCAVSTHSVLLEFQKGASKGGAIRLYYRRYSWDGPYEYSVDVHLPQGWALVVEQRPDLWYALQSMQPLHDVQQQAPVRYFAQAGMLQTLEEGQTAEEMRKGASGTFSLAPGLFAFLGDELERCHGEYRGWGEYAVNPKSTLWKAGRPIIPGKPEQNALQRRHSTTGLLCERYNEKSDAQSTNTATHKKPVRRQSLTAQVDPIHGSVAYVEGRRPTIPKSVPTRRQARPSLHSSMPDLMTEGGDQSTVGRERVQRRHSLAAPVRTQVSYVLPQPAANQNKTKVHPFNGDDSHTSITADFSISEAGVEDDIIGPVPSLKKGRRHSVGVTRKPRKDSMVGKLMSAFQTSKATTA